MPKIIQKMNDLASGTADAHGVPSGFPEIDEITFGWHPSDLVIIAARPAMGKTAFVLSMARNIAVEHQTPVAIFSLEMSEEQLANLSLIHILRSRSGQIIRGR